jgi:hypothetical protein
VHKENGASSDRHITSIQWFNDPNALIVRNTGRLELSERPMETNDSNQDEPDTAHRHGLSVIWKH